METLTKSDQALIIEIARNNCNIKSKGQTTFNCKFYESISKLVRLGFVSSHNQGIDKRIKVYQLKDTGKLLAMVLLGNEKKKDYMVFFLSSNLFEITYEEKVNSKHRKESLNYKQKQKSQLP